MLLVSLTWAYYSLEFYRSEIFYKNKNYSLAQENFAHPKYLIELGEYNKAEKLAWTISQKNLREQIIMQENREKICTSLMKLYPSVENYFYCWKILKWFWNDTLAKQYYINGLDNLPDLWNGDSPYWNNYFIKHTVTWNRFFSEKFSELEFKLLEV